MSRSVPCIISYISDLPASNCEEEESMWSCNLDCDGCLGLSLISNTMTTLPRRHSIFKPCIDLHDGQVVQIVGGTLSDDKPEELKTNFIARRV